LEDLGLTKKAKQIVEGAKKEKNGVLPSIHSEGDVVLYKYTLPDGRVIIEDGKQFYNGREFCIRFLIDEKENPIPDSLWPLGDLPDPQID